MQSFRTELENPIVEKDIVELEKKIRLFNDDKIDEERFRSLRLARGIYGQRQEGVQMIRIKLPYGKVTSKQLRRIADVSDEYSTGNLHITTRQDIQIHYVSLDRTPQLWAELEKDEVTIREACGNTVRNITASPEAGIDPEEVFDASPYANAMFHFFLRNPICQEMGRKFKIAFSSSGKDTGLTYIHDLGFIPKIKNGEKGFKVLLGGGLGSQPRPAELLYDFLPANKIIPATESVLRVFDRYGERSKRLKARMKFLIKDIGKDAFVALVEEEQKAISQSTVEINDTEKNIVLGKEALTFNGSVPIENLDSYNLWKKTCVFPQNKGLFAIGIKVQLGNFSSEKARKLADLIHGYAGDELRFTLRQNILIRHVKEMLLPYFYAKLSELDMVTPGYESIADITACPGTDTCNLGIAGSTEISKELERVLVAEYPKLIEEKNIIIKISGCMNACGQHNMSHIGFQGMSMKNGKLIAPALQVLMGGSPLGDGEGRFSDKLIKIPSKRGPQVLRLILDNYQEKNEGLSFIEYYDKHGKIYFYDLLKPLSDPNNLTEDDYIDWGYKTPYVQEVGVGECAGVVIDLVATLFFESEEKLDNSKNALLEKKWANSIYYSYTAFVNTAKAILLSENTQTNTQNDIIAKFDETFIASGKLTLDSSFSELVYLIKKNEPTEAFAMAYHEKSKLFLQQITKLRISELERDKSV